jgi:hypothetical protein
MTLRNSKGRFVKGFKHSEETKQKLGSELKLL